MSIPRELSPEDLGFDPTRFPAFREIQYQLADYAVYGDPYHGKRRFTLIGASGGSGKTLAAQLMAHMMGVKTVVLTYTKGLQDQVANDRFPGLIDIKGKNNYECSVENVLHPEIRYTCDQGYDNDCECVGKPGCTHYDQMQKARAAKIVSTNYSAWITNRSVNKTAFEMPGEPVELLIMDEAHKSFAALDSFLSVWIGHTALHSRVPEEMRRTIGFFKGKDHGVVTQEWIDTLTKAQAITDAEKMDLMIEEGYKSQEAAYHGSEKYRKLSKLSEDLGKIVFHVGEKVASVEEDIDSNDMWIWQETKSGYKFDCVFPGKYAERYLFSGVPNVVMISATARPKLAQLLRVKQSERLYKEWPRVFPAVNSPVVHVKTGKMGKKSTEEEKQKAIQRLDEFLDLGWWRLKGLVHCASYPRAEWVQAHSRFGRYMLLNKRGENADEMAERFRRAEPPCILVSPSYTTGFDFDLVEQQEYSWQVVIKLPWPDRSDPVVQARMDADPDWYGYETANAFWQSTFRFTRRPEAKCVTLVTDDSIGFLMRSAKEHCPSWARVQERPELPRPPAEAVFKRRVEKDARRANG